MQHSTVLNVLVVDATDLTRNGIRRVLDSQPDMCVVGEAAGASLAVELLRTYRPDVVLLDVQLRDGSGIEVCEAVHALGIDAAILVLAGECSEETVRRYVEHGAGGYLLKSASVSELRSAILDVAAGKMTFSPAVAESVRALVTAPRRPEPTQGVDRHSLTRRESQVLEQLEGGLRNREIATTLGISKKTVETHVRNVLLKLGVHTRTQAVARALRL